MIFIKNSLRDTWLSLFYLKNSEIRIGLSLLHFSKDVRKIPFYNDVIDKSPLACIFQTCDI